MARRKLERVFSEFSAHLTECKLLATDADNWSRAAPGAAPHLSGARRDAIIELAYLQAFLAWENFLERTFILYLTGHRAPRGRVPFRYAFPPDHKTAHSWMIPEARPHAEWT